MFPIPKWKGRSKVHPSIDRGHVDNDEMEGDIGVSRPNIMGTRVAMMRNVQILGIHMYEGAIVDRCATPNFVFPPFIIFIFSFLDFSLYYCSGYK